MMQMELFIYYMQVFGGITGEDPEETFGDDWILDEAPWDKVMEDERAKEKKKRLGELKNVRERLKEKKEAIMKDKLAKIGQVDGQ